MKIIFLDYDGVVNNLVFHDVNGEPDFYCENFCDDNERKVNDFQAIAWLNKICREFDCSIVVTSTWRGDPNYKECLYRAGLNKNIQILGKTPHLNYIPHETRGREILSWIEHENDYSIEDFVILDDDADMGPVMSHLIKTDTYKGLGYKEYVEICERWEKE